MEFIELERTINGDTTNTLIQYNIDGQVVEVNIPHFRPTCEEDIQLGILNRYITERRKLFPEIDQQAEDQTNDYIEDLNSTEQ